MRRHFMASLLLCISLVVRSSARLPVPSGFEDVRGLADHAPLVFRGKVADLILAKDTPSGKEGIAVIGVDRWYKVVKATPSVKVHFVYDAIVRDGHNCVSFAIGTSWIVFATPGRGEVLELSDDCEGALRVSSLLGPDASSNFLLQMEADFAAGLNDTDSGARIASVQRIAGLEKISSAEPLHRVIAGGTEEESKWAIFAALKTGDISALPLAVPILLNLHHEKAKQIRQSNGFVFTQTYPYPQPEGMMALAISRLHSPKAIPSLTTLANGASDDLVRMCAKQALAEIGRRRR